MEAHMESFAVNNNNYPTNVYAANDPTDVFCSKTWVGKLNSRVVFGSPAEMLSPFYEIVTPLSETIGMELKIDASHDVINKNDDDTRNISYGRVKIEALIGNGQHVIGQNAAENISETVGLIYAFDLGHPEIIVYHGTRVMSCLNLMVFGATDVRRFRYLQEGTEKAYEYINDYASSFGRKTEEHAAIIKKLMDTNWDKDDVNTNVGKMLIHTTLNNSYGSAAVNALVADLVNPKSKYALNNNGSTTAWNVLQALTQHVTDKSYLNVAPVKTLQMSEHIMELVN